MSNIRILAVARDCNRVDADVLQEALDDGRARRRVLDDYRDSHQVGVEGSPHLFVPDESLWHNPGIDMHWEGEHGKGFPMIDEDDPTVYESIVVRAAANT